MCIEQRVDQGAAPASFVIKGASKSIKCASTKTVPDRRNLKMYLSETCRVVDCAYTRCFDRLR